ncbi:MAG: hypothetical protein V1754_07775, partial [Pseudomonadota bacterium]
MFHIINKRTHIGAVTVLAMLLASPYLAQAKAGGPAPVRAVRSLSTTQQKTRLSPKKGVAAYEQLSRRHMGMFNKSGKLVHLRNSLVQKTRAAALRIKSKAKSREATAWKQAQRTLSNPYGTASKSALSQARTLYQKARATKSVKTRTKLLKQARH